MLYSTYSKPSKMSNPLMDKIVVFAADFLELDETFAIDFDDDFEGIAGWCTHDYEDGIVISVNPKLSRTEICKTIFHEMVHAKQYVRGELVSGIGLKPSRWFGKAYKSNNYWDLPWEKEAYETEEAMWDIFSTEVLKKKLK
jgi:hypothetical protein